MSFFSTLNFIITHPLNKEKKLKALLGYFKWQIGSRLVPGDVIFQWIDNARFIVKAGETGLTQNIYCGLHELYEMAYVLHVLDSEDIFVDIGANAGSYTILACAVNGARGYCFEPVPSTFQRLMSNIKINDLLGRVKAYNMGLADQEGDLLFTSTLGTINHVIAENEVALDPIKVKVFPLDSVLGNVFPSLIKIDVEGMEMRVIKGMLRTLENPSLHSVIMELNGSGKRYGFNDDTIIEQMLDLGFQMYAYEPFARELNPISKENMRSGNVLFLRNEEYIKRRLASTPRVKIGACEI